MADRAEEIAQRVNGVTGLANVMLTRLDPTLPEFCTFVGMANAALIEAAARKFDTDTTTIASIVGAATTVALGVVAKDRSIN